MRVWNPGEKPDFCSFLRLALLEKRDSNRISKSVQQPAIFRIKCLFLSMVYMTVEQLFSAFPTGSSSRAVLSRRSEDEVSRDVRRLVRVCGPVF